MIEQRRKNPQFFCAYMVDFCRPSHILQVQEAFSYTMCISSLIASSDLTCNFCTKGVFCFAHHLASYNATMMNTCKININLIVVIFVHGYLCNTNYTLEL